MKQTSSTTPTPPENIPIHVLKPDTPAVFTSTPAHRGVALCLEDDIEKGKINFLYDTHQIYNIIWRIYVFTIQFYP